MAQHVIILLVKIVSSVERAEAILDGQLYCNTVGYFRENDRYEGSFPLTGTVRINNVMFDPEDLIEPPQLTLSRVSDLNVFCMFAWAAPKLDKDRITFDPVSQLGSLKRLSKRFGNHAVVITNVTKFLQRADKAVAPSNFRVLGRSRNLVDYVNPDDGIAPPTTPWDLLAVPLRKNKKFSHEKEYRLVYWTTSQTPGPVTLNIGDIRDIAIRMRTADIYNSLKINDLPLSHFE